MSLQKSVPAILSTLLMLGLLHTAQAQPAAVGADRIYAAEAKAAALKAENEQLRQSVTTQSKALKRLEENFRLLQKEGDLEANNLRDANQALQARLEQQKTAAREQAKNEASLDARANQAQANVSRLEALLAEQQARSEQLKARLNQLQTTNSKQQQLLAEAPALQEQLTHTAEQNKSLRLQLARSDAQLQQAQATDQEQQKLREQVAKLRRTISSELEPAQVENQRLQSQLVFLQERNNTLQQAMSESPSQEQLQALRQQKSALQEALNLANQKVENVQQTDSSSDQATQKLQAKYDTLQSEYNSLWDGMRHCEAARKAQAQTSSTQTSSLPEDIQRIAELETSLDRANQELRNRDAAFKQELQVERSMAAGTQAEMEQQYKAQLEAAQKALKNCQGG